MSKIKEIKYESRKFLNKTGQGRSTVVFLYDGWSLGGDWVIGDCTRQVQLDFNVFLTGRTNSDSAVQANLKKIDLIAAQLQELRDTICTTYEQYKATDRAVIAAERGKFKRNSSLNTLLSEE